MFFFFNVEGGSRTFGDRLRAARENAGYTAKDFASRLDLKYETYVGYETRNREPKYETLVKIAAALHVTVDELLGISSRQESPEDDIEKPLTHLQEILQKPTAKYKGYVFDDRSREELSARVQEVAARAEVLSEFDVLEDD